MRSCRMLEAHEWFTLLCFALLCFALLYCWLPRYLALIPAFLVHRDCWHEVVRESLVVTKSICRLDHRYRCRLRKCVLNSFLRRARPAIMRKELSDFVKTKDDVECVRFGVCTCPPSGRSTWPLCSPKLMVKSTATLIYRSVFAY